MTQDSRFDVRHTRHVHSATRPVPGDLEKTFSFLESLIRPGSKYDLETVGFLLERLDAPHRRFPWIQIVGSNGKGSTSALLTDLLTSAGYRVGFFSSPHLVSLRERMRVGRSPITPSQLADVTRRLQRRIQDDPIFIESPPSFFEAGFAMACMHFADQKVDIAIAESGLGGRYDATSVVDPIASILTSISLDHEKTLGPTLEHILAEKIAIARSGIPMVTADLGQDLNRLARDHCRQVGSPLHVVAQAAESALDPERWGTRFRTTPAGELQFVSLMGRHQANNATLALAALDHLSPRFQVEPGSRRIALETTSWPARFQKIDEQIILDGGHNMSGTRALVDTYREAFGDLPAVKVIGFSGDKRLEEMIEILREIPGPFVVTRAIHWRSCSMDQICEYVRRQDPERVLWVEPDPAEAVRRARDLAGKKDMILITGSLYLLGEIISAGAVGDPDDVLGLDLGGFA